MYITPTVIGLANGSPVLPSYNVCFPSGDNEDEEDSDELFDDDNLDDDDSIYDNDGFDNE